jgi:RES domain-containing protein
MTMVAYRVDCDNIVDLTDPQLLKSLDVTEAMLGCAWEDLACQKHQPPTWQLADRLQADGFFGAKVRSFAPGCSAQHQNLVLWRWDSDASRIVEVIDDFERLPKTTDAWR